MASELGEKAGHLFVKPLVELYEMVNSHGRVKFSDAAKKFNVSENMIHKWGRILEKHDLIKIQHNFIGGSELKR